MNNVEPTYSTQNTKASYQIKWSLTIFWKSPLFLGEEKWLSDLNNMCQKDSIAIESHQLSDSKQESQLFISSSPKTSPQKIVKNVKGRLQRIIKNEIPEPFKRNFFIRSIGVNTRTQVENYISTQLQHHQMADPRVQKRLNKYQVNANVDLSSQRSTNHGLFVYNLHLVFVRDGRWHEIDDNILCKQRDMVINASRKKQHILSRLAIFPDHFHVCLGVNFDESPEEIALSYMNNIVFIERMRPVLQYSYYVGTVGEYSKWAIIRKWSK